MKQKKSAPDWALRASRGSFELLDRLLEKDELELRQAALAWLRDWSAGGQAYLKEEHRSLCRDRQSARHLARALAALLRDLLYLKLGAAGKILNIDQLSFLQNLSAGLSQERVARACDQALGLESKLDRNHDASLVFEQFWIETNPHT